MRKRHRPNLLHRRAFLAAGAAALAGCPSTGSAQTVVSRESAKLSAQIAEFIVGFDLKSAPPLAIERARLAFVDTVRSEERRVGKECRL